MFVKEYTNEIEKRLSVASFPFDISLNGVQIGAPDRELERVAFSVDASFDTIDKAVEGKADVLVVHHGLFWGSPIAIRDAHYRRVKRALDSGLSLFACHLPLDAHPLYGNNAQMAMCLGMKEFDPFGMYHGQSIGYKGRLPFPMTCQEIAKLLGFSELYGMNILPFGKEEVETVGIISGGAADDVFQAMEAGLDCFVTGECRHELYHTLRESGMDMVCGGHYQSEVFGVKAVARYLEKEHGIQTVFIDRKTGL